MSKDPPEISDEELRERVLYSVMGAVARLAELFKFPLKAVTNWIEIAYYHRLQKDGFSQTDAAEFFDVSRRKVAQLSAELKKNFLKPEQQAGLPRRIEFMLWAGEASEGRICQSFDEANEEVREALDQLVREDRIVRHDGRTTHYEAAGSEFRLYKDDWISKIDGLNKHLDTLVNGIYARFFDDSDAAFARNVDFRIEKDRLDELRELYEEEVFPTLAELDEDAKTKVERGDEDETVEISLGFHWAPYEYCRQILESESNDD